MKQIFFDGKGRLSLRDVPAPVCPPHGALIRVSTSLISTGTESSQAAGGGSLLRKALQEPHLIARAAQLAMRQGVGFTARAVQDISEAWFEAGYSAAGQVVEVGAEVNGWRAGERAAAGGAGHANHAEFDAVPQNLLAAVPQGVSDRAAAFTTVGAIALQGVRRAEAALGETVVVVGLGLIGQITAQLLNAAGCRVIGIDPRPERRTLAERLAAAAPLDPAQGSPAAQVMALTGHLGADKVILCAATKSSGPVNQAFRMCRERGRVVMVGAMGMDLERTEFYNRELDFVISRSTGPGRYDPNYEEKGIDYPIGYVRWTEGRNMAAFLALLAAGKLNVEALIAAEYPIDQAAEAYQAAQSGALAVLLTYPSAAEDAPAAPAHTLRQAAQPLTGTTGLALIGAGSFARGTHLPNIKASPSFSLAAVISGGPSAAQAAQKFGAPLASTELHAALDDPAVQAVLIATRHHLHAQQIIAAAQAGKHIFVEKPLALTLADAEAALGAVEQAGVLLTVGFNRRAAPTARALMAALKGIPGPRSAIYRVNAGAIPASHWLNDPQQGGSRLLGEGVHFIDFICGLMDGPPTAVTAQGAADGQDFALTLHFPDDSLGMILYTARGGAGLPKERVEVHAGGGSAVLDDFKTLSFYDLPGRNLKAGQDKGHRTLLENFGAALLGREALIVSGHDGWQALRIALAARESLHSGQAVRL